MSYGATPPPVTENLTLWAQNIVRYLQRTLARLQFKTADASAADDGAILWDAVNGYPVVSKGGVWRQLMMADPYGNSYAIFGQDANVTAAAANTAYKIALDNIAAQGITLTGSPLTEITFLESGLYSLAFTAQIESLSASATDFYFWPRKNGTDMAGSTIIASLHSNGATGVVSRTALFPMTAGDVLSVMWATDRTTGQLTAHAATAFSPSAPSVTLAITRVRA